MTMNIERGPFRAIEENDSILLQARDQDGHWHTFACLGCAPYEWRVDEAGQDLLDVLAEVKGELDERIRANVDQMMKRAAEGREVRSTYYAGQMPQGAR